VLSTRYIKPGQRIVIVDDFLANGRTATALIDMAREAGAEVLGPASWSRNASRKAASTSRRWACPSPPWPRSKPWKATGRSWPAAWRSSQRIG
jgi:predicted phosphoribosyltransferase